MFICDEMWNAVTLYGPPAEIERFKALCIFPAPPDDIDGCTHEIDFEEIASVPSAAPRSFGQWGHSGAAWNFHASLRKDFGVFSFKFDTAGSFPVPIFEHLAELFPTLLFDCNCIADDDRSMGFGWFNTPPGGEHFCDDYDVPEGYWDTRTHKREPMAELRYQSLLAEIKAQLRKAENGGWWA